MSARRNFMAQAIRYAAMVSKMTFDKVADVFAAHLAVQERQESARELLLDFLGWDAPDEERFRMYALFWRRPNSRESSRAQYYG